MVCIYNESISAGRYCGIELVDDSCTILYSHMIYMGCEDREPMYMGCGRDWVGMGHWSALAMEVNGVKGGV